jgi:hypothetical protein
MSLADIVHLPMCATFAARWVFPALVRLLKPTIAVGILTYLQIKFPRSWVGSLGLARLESFGKRLASRRALCVFLIALSLLAIRSAVIPVSGIPLPRYHDEFSYLLAGDTFAHGRLTNPTHPMWMHFETFHVIWHPTYMSMYPPGEGLVLAAGQILGCAWIGQLLVAALMCASICWMLQGWIPPQWALLGGLLTLPRLGLLSYWTNGYWSACLPALGGALVLGALPRIKRSCHWRDSVIMAVGLFILANTRPYEGFLLATGVGVALSAWIFGRHAPPLRRLLVNFILPLVLTLAPLAAWTSFYYYRVTGNPFRMTYEVNREAYGTGRYFIWQSRWPEKTYDHAKMKELYDREAHETQENQTLAGFIWRGWSKLRDFWRVYLELPLPFVLIALPCAVRDRKLRVPWMIAAIFLMGAAVETWFLPHYSAPATALVFLILLQCMRHLRLFRWRAQPIGLALVRAIAVIYIGTVVLRVGLAVAHIHPEHEWQNGDLQRASIVQQLKTMPGQHVVLVNYSPDFDPNREWVYNRSNIDESKIVWARDMGAEKNEELFQYFRGRHFWMVHADSSPPHLEPLAYDAAR